MLERAKFLAGFPVTPKMWEVEAKRERAAAVAKMSDEPAERFPRREEVVMAVAQCNSF